MLEFKSAYPRSEQAEVKVPRSTRTVAQRSLGGALPEWRRVLFLMVRKGTVIDLNQSAREEVKIRLPKRQALESGRAGRKPCVEQSRQTPGSGNRRLPQPSQPTKQSTEPVRMFSSTYGMAFTDEGLESAAQLHLAEVHTKGPLEERDIIAAMKTAQTQSAGAAQQRSQQQGLTNISLEEQKILLSLDRLNHQLHCVQEHIGSNTGNRVLTLIDAPSTKETKATNHHKNRASSANNCARYQKKF
ncbi:centrosomal protein of 126 kDa [Lates japonicus]|uniref:Centrosomal protein of 126 kDa n=1 Tax=Lates japonicus TaxID=270547 RepID=A0AAD3MG54_LATJO|nr:centrosomal protein of 126 kDa [Lates japonicus]